MNKFCPYCQSEQEFTSKKGGLCCKCGNDYITEEELAEYIAANTIDTSIIVPPHKYPSWVIGLLLVAIASFGMSIPKIPSFFNASRQMDIGDKHLENFDYDEAIKNYKNILKKFPDSKAAKINFAICSFGNTKPDDDEIGLSALTDLSLNDSEMKKIKAVMPKEYEMLFYTEKR